MTARAFLGAGDLYIQRIVGGVAQALQGPYECKKFEVKPNVELKEAVSKGRSSYGQVIESVAIPQPSDLTVEMGEVNKESMALALLGTVAALSQASGTMTDQAVVTDHDAWVSVGHAALNATGITVENTAGTTTYVEGTDYLLNRQLGLIKTLSSGTIPDATSVNINGGYAAITGNEIRGSTQPQLRAKFILDGKNFVDDSPVIVTVHEAVIAADAAFDFLADDFNVVSLPGRMKTPTGFNEPFTVHLRTAA